MKKIALTLGAAVIALTAVSATNAEAGGKKFHFGWHKPHWNTFYLGEPYHCFWKKKKIFTPKGWFFKKVKICKPVHYFH